MRDYSTEKFLAVSTSSSNKQLLWLEYDQAKNRTKTCDEEALSDFITVALYEHVLEID